MKLLAVSNFVTLVTLSPFFILQSQIQNKASGEQSPKKKVEKIVCKWNIIEVMCNRTVNFF